MDRDVLRVRQELAQLVESGVDFPAELRVRPTAKPPRKAAVLILFGVLDQVGAQPITNAEPFGVPDTLDVLLLRRADDLSHHPGQVAFPGGGADEGDSSPAYTALREAREETGLEPGAVRVLGRLADVLVPNSGNLVTPVLGWWSSPGDLVADGVETVEVFRVPVGELLDPANRWTAVYRKGLLRTVGPMFRLGPRQGGHVVWGFTALILDSLFDSLGWTIPWDSDRQHLL